MKSTSNQSPDQSRNKNSASDRYIVTDNPLTASYRITGIYFRTARGRWKCIKRLCFRRLIWTFSLRRTFMARPLIPVFEGTVKEQFPGMERDPSQFVYYPSRRLLCIYRSEGKCPSDASTVRYRVEKAGKNKFFLYDLLEMKSEPNDYRYRTKIKKF